MNQLLENAIGGGLLVLVVLLLRLMKKIPKRVRCALWGLVGLRLLLPVSLPSVVALLPKVQPQSTGGPVQVQSNLPAVDAAINPVLEQIGTVVQPVETRQTISLAQILLLVWAVGALALGIYGLVCAVRVRRQLCTAVLLRENIYQSEWVASPFVMGILRPRIYVPFDVEPDAYMLAHERAHIARRDYVTKPLSFVLLCVYWFQPLLWVAYKLYAKDIELACDEKVVRQLPLSERGEYARAMLAWAIKLQKSGVHTAFAENYLEVRVHEVMTYKKPKIWVSIISVLLCVVLAACAVLGPPDVPNGKVVQPPIEGIRWGMTPDEVRTALEAQDYTVSPMGDSATLIVKSADVKVLGTALEETRGSLQFYFTEPCAANRESVLLSGVQISGLPGDAMQTVSEELKKQCGITVGEAFPQGAAPNKENMDICLYELQMPQVTQSILSDEAFAMWDACQQQREKSLSGEALQQARKNAEARDLNEIFPSVYYIQAFVDHQTGEPLELNLTFHANAYTYQNLY